MSGILDNKSRVIDAIITQEGRRQVALGKLKVEHVSFSDAGAYYRADVVSGSADASNRFYFEACSLPQDQITFEADDSGRLKPFKNDNDLQLRAGQLMSYVTSRVTSSIFSGSLENVTILSGDEFASTAGTMLGSSIGNFNKLQLIGTLDKIFEDDKFELGPTNIEFVISNERPLADQERHATNINSLESLFNDVRLSKVKNFSFLPPINKLDDVIIDKRVSRNLSKHALGCYRPWGRSDAQGLTYAQLKRELRQYERLGYMKTISFDPTSRDNRLLGQFFEVNYNTLRKLDVIDFGIHRTGDPAAPRSHIFFVGRVMTDENDCNTFIHLFTLVFE